MDKPFTISHDLLVGPKTWTTLQEKTYVFGWFRQLPAIHTWQCLWLEPAKAASGRFKLLPYEPSDEVRVFFCAPGQTVAQLHADLTAFFRPSLQEPTAKRATHAPKVIPCEACGKPFLSKLPWQKFCSRECQVTSWRQAKAVATPTLPAPLTRQCKQCSAEYLLDETPGLLGLLCPVCRSAVTP